MVSVVPTGRCEGPLCWALLQRVIARPDFLITALDWFAGTTAFVAQRSFPAFVTTNALPGLSGPGTIQSGGAGVNIGLGKAGPIYINPNLFFFPPPLVKNEATEQLFYLWGSFDGTTNTPIVYPDTASLANLENQLFLQMTNAGPLPVGKVGVPYSTPLAANGSVTPPYSWSIPASSPLLPPGLTGLSRSVVADSGNGVITISGTPAVAGFYDFIVRVADVSGRGVQRNFTLEIDP